MRILVVEDDRNQLLLYDLELSKEGYIIVTASDGIQALKIFERELIFDNPFDLVIVDINMPKMNGIELIGRILSTPNARRLPIIINTAYSSYRDNFMAWSADAYIIKSSDLSELKNTIKNLLEAVTQTKTQSA